MSIALQIKKKVVNSNYAYFRSRKINFKYDLKNEIIVEYVVSGIFGIFRNWIIYDIGSIDENVLLISDLAISTMKHVQFK